MKMTHTCPDCPGESLQLIRLLDSSNGNPRVGFAATAAEFTPGFFKPDSTGSIGEVHGLLCPQCSQVRLYMLTKEDARFFFEEAQNRSAERDRERVARQRAEVARQAGKLSLFADDGGLSVSGDDDH